MKGFMANTCIWGFIDAEILLCSRCGDGIEGLREQGHTNAIVCTFIEEFDTLFEVWYMSFLFSVNIVQQWTHKGVVQACYNIE